MFIKTSKSHGREYVQIVESYREEGKIKHRTLVNLGRVDLLQGNESIQNLGRRLLELSEGASKLVDLMNASQAKILNWGYKVYEKIWKNFELPEIFKDVKNSRKITYDIEATCFRMVIQHLLDPKSKLGTYEEQERYANLPRVSLQHFYRSLDVLVQEKEKIEQKLFERNITLFNMKVDVVFYDVTTFSFESVKRDSLRDFGYSKNGKFNEVQVVLGLLIDSEGRPIGYELFPGNTFDGKTMIKALEILEKRFKINNVIIVADRGLNNKKNLKHITDKGYGYIVASRLKSLPRAVVEKALEPEGFTPISDTEEGDFSFKVMDHKNVFKDKGQTIELDESLVITYSTKRAKKDMAELKRFVEKATKLLNRKGLITSSQKRGGRKYLKATKKAPVQWSMDTKAIERDKRLAGYYGIQTSEKNMSPKEILNAYHSLWKIEESFRIMKSTLEVEPVFVWTEQRIKGHFMMCFIAFLLERTLEFQLKRNGHSASPRKIRKALNALNFVEIEIEGKPYYVKTKAPSLSNKILRSLRIAPPKNVVRQIP